MKRFYLDGPFGQVHCLEWGDDLSQPAIICLSPSPFSSRAYLTLAPLLAEQRRVIAVDYPGFGNSDTKDGELTIADLSLVTQAVIDECSPEQAVDLFGFHTGTLVAVETAIQYPSKVNKVVLTDVPFFTPEKQAKLLDAMPAVLPLDSEFSSLEKTWRFCVETKLEHIPLNRAYEMFVDHISPGERGNTVFRAAFTYPCEERFKQVPSPTWVIATSSSLYEASCNTATMIAESTLVEMRHIKAAVLEAGASEIAEMTLELLANRE